MGFTKADPDLFRAWERAQLARAHAEGFLDSLRMPLQAQLKEALRTRGKHLSVSFYVRGKKARAVFPSLQMMQVHFEVPERGEVRISAGLWAWDGLHFEVKTRFPKDLADSSAAAAVAKLRELGYIPWRQRVLSRFLPLDEATLRSEMLQEDVVAWSRKRFDEVVDSGILEHAPEGLGDVESEDTSNADDLLEE